jgi:hypothetical protein
MNNKYMPDEIYAVWDGTAVRLQNDGVKYTRADMSPAPKAVYNCPTCHGRGQYVGSDNEVFDCDVCDSPPTPPNAALDIEQILEDLDWVLDKHGVYNHSDTEFVDFEDGECAGQTEHEYYTKNIMQRVTAALRNTET